MATKKAHRNRSGNPAIRAASSSRIGQASPVDYFDEPLPGISPPVIGTPRGSVRAALAARVMRLSELENAAHGVEQAQLTLSRAVADARDAGLSWADIGDALGLDRETARRRWTPPAT
jgi:hypothetical protein